jgi:hypothetical protein
MKAKRKIADLNWVLDDNIIVVTIPMQWKRRGGRKLIIAPDGGDAWAPTKPRPDEALIRALARAHRWKRLIEDGTYRSAAQLAEVENITRSYVTRLLNLALLAPDISEAILNGEQAPKIQLSQLISNLPSDWKDQRDIVLSKRETTECYLTRSIGLRATYFPLSSGTACFDINAEQPCALGGPAPTS